MKPQDVRLPIQLVESQQLDVHGMLPRFFGEIELNHNRARLRQPNRHVVGIRDGLVWNFPELHVLRNDGDAVGKLSAGRQIEFAVLICRGCRHRAVTVAFEHKPIAPFGIDNDSFISQQQHLGPHARPAGRVDDPAPQTRSGGPTKVDLGRF